MKFKLGEQSCKIFFSIAGTRQPVSLQQTWARTAHGLMWSLALGLSWGASIPSALAAEQVTLRLGPLEQKIAIADLERFAKTGKLPPALQIYAPVLTPQVRELLNRRLQIDPKLADKVIDEWLRSPPGKQLVDSLGVAIPDGTIPQIQAAVALAAQQANGLNLVSFLRAYPKENVTLDASAALAIALQFNPTYLQSQALGPLLESELAVTTNTPFKPAFNPAVPGSQPVQQQTLTFLDRQRYRTILVDLYFPSTEPGEQRGQASRVRREQGEQGRNSPRHRVTASPRPLPHPSSLTSLSEKPLARLRPSPLVVISHGLGADRRFFTYLARHLASHGFTVAALEHPGSNSSWLGRVSDRSDAKLLPAKEFVERPKDVSFLLDELAKLNQQKSLLQGKLNTQQVSLIGHSLGGYTALALAGAEVNISELRQFCKSATAISRAPADWLQCAAADLPDRKLKLRDQRVNSAIAFNPIIGNLFGKTGLTQVATPVLLLAGTEDAVTPVLNHQLRPFTQLPSPKYLLTAIGGTHLSISDTANLSSTSTSSTLIQERRGEETKTLQQLIQGVSLAFIKQLTPEAKIYEPFLTPAYAESLSTPALPLRLSTELPASVTSWLDQTRG
ncbi:alpha/beta hydrolase [Chroococcidiopsis sp. CCMEE 29]|uniref:alpha/beta hydrolase n=1 Tax=Chroococcidiopsis sp. CCMEE 29 TaxID=155894 RepID=UPI00202285E8|nr:alpha/beta hydrolase [Chroococcidiopsis sp. CCMEE 29]